MNGESPAEAGPTGVGTQQQISPPVVGTVVHLVDPELVAAEIIERRGPGYSRKVAAWVLVLADEVTS